MPNDHPKERRRCPMGRREFLRLMTAGTVAGAGVLSLPFTHWQVHAQRASDRVADRLLILNLFGGIRSSSAFHASTEQRYNPWGLLSETGRLRLGTLLGDAITDPRLAPGEPERPLSDAAYQLGPDWENERLPRLQEAASGFSVLGTWNERRGDHITSQIEETTGGTRNDPGLLTRVNMALADETGQVDIPSFALNVAESVQFGRAPGPTARHAPVELNEAADLPGQSHLPAELLGRVGERWAGESAAFDRLDQQALQSLSGANRVLAEAHLAQRRANSQLGERLSQPWIDGSDDGASYGEVEVGGRRLALTNSMLLELFHRGLGPDPTDPEQARPLPEALMYEHPFARDSANLALGIRLLQLGAPVVVVELENFDLHADERVLGPVRYRTLGRWWASLWWLLSRLRDPADPSRAMLDRTMVVSTSEFGRDPAELSGFNDGDGSDHGAFPSCYYLAHAAMGAGVVGGRVVGDVETSGSSAYDARRAQERYHTHDFLATLMYALGFDHASAQWGFPETGSPVARLWSAS